MTMLSGKSIKQWKMQFTVNNLSIDRCFRSANSLYGQIFNYFSSVNFANIKSGDFHHGSVTCMHCLEMAV